MRPQVSQVMTLPAFTLLVKMCGTLVKQPVQAPSTTGITALPMR